jgi:hypothetical protein
MKSSQKTPSPLPFYNDHLSSEQRARSASNASASTTSATSPLLTPSLHLASSAASTTTVYSYLKDNKLLHTDLINNNYIKMSSRLNKSRERNSPGSYFSDSSFGNGEPQYIYIEYLLDPSVDSLHKLSMEFCVSITDLKRINSLQNDRDVYALKTVKIPVKPNSIHTEKYAGQLKYSDQIVSRLAAGSAPLHQELDSTVNSNGGGSSSANADSNDDEDRSASDDAAYTVGRGRDGALMAESEFTTEESTALLLDSNEHDRMPRATAKETKKYFKKIDTNLKSLKNQNNELITGIMSNTEQLVPIQTCSYMVEREQYLNESNRHKGLINVNVRHILIWACIIAIIAPIFVILYRYIYITEHTGASLKP